jgi:hypothetical protein
MHNIPQIDLKIVSSHIVAQPRKLNWPWSSTEADSDGSFILYPASLKVAWRNWRLGKGIQPTLRGFFTTWLPYKFEKKGGV